MLTFIIQTPGYDKNVGGFCALHYLADRLVALGEQNVYVTTDKINPRWKAKTICLESPHFLNDSFYSVVYKLCNTLQEFVFFNTFKRKLVRLQRRLFPTLLWKHFDINSTVVICGEALVGTPFNAKHVVRWIMNTPGLLGGKGIYDVNDHIFQYHTWFKVNEKYQVQGELRAIDLNYHLSTYQNQNIPNRKPGAYLIRKGTNKTFNQHPEGFIHADPILENCSDEEAADFFNRIETFVSYDDMTFISVQAALCGCSSIIIGGEGDRSVENLKKVNRINGVAYGWDDLEWANTTMPLLRPHYEKINQENLETIRNFRDYCYKNICP